MKHLERIFAACASLALMASCADLSKVKDDIEDLNSRVTALEAQVQALNDNIQAIKTLSDGGKTISKVETDDEAYKLTLSDGTVLTLRQGSIGIGKFPLLAIDEEGWWTVDYQDGAGVQYVLSNGKKVKGRGDDGTTPLFSVDADGFWTVSYDGGHSYQQVKDVNGHPVKAVADTSGTGSDSYFANVEYQDGYIALTLKNGEKYLVPVVSDFFCRIETDGSDQVFKYGSTKHFNVEMRGVADAAVLAPNGWSATLSASILTVQAPKAPTRSSIADSKKDVSVIAFSGQGYSSVSKIKVFLEGTGGDDEQPAAAITFLEATSTMLAFKVVTENTTSWKYILQEASLPAPSIAHVAENGTEGTDAIVKFENLMPETRYILYVVPLRPPLSGSLATGAGTTAAISDLYEAWQAGYPLVIAGISYTKQDLGAATLVKATSKNQNLAESVHGEDPLTYAAGVFFLEAEKGCDFTMDKAEFSVIGNTFLIGRHRDDRVRINVSASGQRTLLKTGSLVYANLYLDFSQKDDFYFMDVDGGAFDKLHFDNCVIRLSDTPNQPIMYTFQSERGIRSIRLCNSVVDAGSAAGNAQLFGISSPGIRGYKDVLFKNNIFYKGNPCTMTVFSYNNDPPVGGSIGNETFSVENNTFINCIGNNIMFKLYHVKDLLLKKNVFWSDETSGYHVSFMTFCKENHSFEGSRFDVTDNIYYCSGGLGWCIMHDSLISTHNTIEGFPEQNWPHSAENDPLPQWKHGVFQTNDGYGSTLTALQ